MENMKIFDFDKQKLSDKVKLQFSDDYPLRIEYTVKDKFKIAVRFINLKW